MNQTKYHKLKKLFLFLSFTAIFTFAIYLIMLQGLRGFAALSFPIIPIYALAAITICYFITKQLKKQIDDWSLFSKITLGINFLLLGYLIFLTISNFGNTSGMEKALWHQMSWRGWAGPETHYYFEPFVGWFGFFISVFTYFQIRLYEMDNLLSKILFRSPIFIFILLIVLHLVFIKKPIFYG